MVRFFLGFCYVIARLWGWKYVINFPRDLKKAVVVVAPHTTTRDFVLAMGSLYVWNRPVSYMAKKELFKGFTGLLLRSTGAMPIDRDKKANVVQQMAEQFAKRDQLILILSAEGTRKAVKKWKSGFYHIAKEARVPLWLGIIDAGTKVGGIIQEQPMKGKAQKEVMSEMQQFFSTVEALDPKGWNPDFL